MISTSASEAVERFVFAAQTQTRSRFRERERGGERERGWLEGMLGSAGVEFCPLQTSLFLHVLSNAHKVAPLRNSHSSK